MQMPFVTTVSFADRDGTAVHLQYGVSAESETEARSAIERRLINQELYHFDFGNPTRDVARSRVVRSCRRRDQAFELS